MTQTATDGRLSPSDLGAEPALFVQRRLKRRDEFEKAAIRRGADLRPGDLERLYRARILVPLYVVSRPEWDIRLRRRFEHVPGPRATRAWSMPVGGPDLVADAADGLVRDAGASKFRSEASARTTTRAGSVLRHEWLYSPYQLLNVDRCIDGAALLRRPASDHDRWARRRLRRLRDDAPGVRALVALLSALEPVYLPPLNWHVRSTGFDWADHERYVGAFDPRRELRSWGWTPDDVYAQARELLLRAGLGDPIAPWLPLVRQMHPDMWWRLDGAPRLSIERRVAAEMLLSFHEDLQAAGAAEAFPMVPRLANHELNMRIKPQREQLDDVLMNFGLSSHPAMVILFEGPTELEIAPLAMEALGIPRRDSFIRIDETGGEKARRDLLAKYVGLPALGDREGDVASLIRPLTRLLVVVDGDRHWRTAVVREAERQRLVGLIHGRLPSTLRTQEARDDLDSVVTFETWGDGLAFERAHFSDRETADALIELGVAPKGTAAGDLEAELSKLAALGKPIDAIWAAWPKPDKRELGRALWPRLRDRIIGARDDEIALRRIPIVRILLDADALARRTPRRHVVMRVGPARDGS
jgi:hypothetical protein